jgi:hypothetical protein
MQVTGKITNITNKTIPKKNGQGTFTIKYVTVDTFTDGDINAGFEKVNVGDQINWQVEINFGEWQKLKPGQGGGGSAPAATGSGGGGAAPRSAGRVYPIPLDHGDNAIVNQNSLAHATKVVLANPAASDKENTDRILLVSFRLANYATGRTTTDEVQAIASSMMVEPTE